MLFSNDVGNTKNVDEVVFRNRLSLLFDVCGPFLEAVFKNHFTEGNLLFAEEIYRQGFDDDAEASKTLGKDSCMSRFRGLATQLIEGE